MKSQELKSSLEAVKTVLEDNKDALKVVNEVRCAIVECKGLPCQQCECYILRINHIIEML